MVNETVIKQIQNKEIQKQVQKRMTPQSELDLHMLITDSAWGREGLSPSLRARLSRLVLAQNEHGKKEAFIENLWEMLGFYTRDMRLANLSVWDGELNYVSYYLDLASDFLEAEMIKPFIICLSRSATRLELSQSKGGFLRRRMNTFSQESLSGETEPPKKSLFGGRGNKK